MGSLRTTAALVSAATPVAALRWWNLDARLPVVAGGNGVNIGVAAKDQMGPNQLCNGVGEGRQCYNFTAAFRESFNSWHVRPQPSPSSTPSR